MHTAEMKLSRCLAVISTSLLAEATMPARGQTTPEATGEQRFDQRAIRTLQGRPAVAVFGLVSLDGATPGLTRRLTHAFVQDAAELVLRRNGIPVAPSCEGGTANCGGLAVEIVATCTKTDLLASNDRLCPLSVRVRYLEDVYSSRNAPGINPSAEFSYREFCPVWEEPSFPVLVTDKLLEDKARRSWTEAIERFSLYYFRANPVK